MTEGAKRILRCYAGVKRCEVRFDGRRWAYLEGGKGEVILFVHGYGMEKDGWNLFIKHWTGSHRVVAPDLPGFGESVRVESWNYDVPHQAERLESFVEALGFSSFHLVGISMGGAIAAYYAGEHPERVKSLCLMAPAGVTSRVPSEAWRAYRETGKIVLLYKNEKEFDRLLDMIFYEKPYVPGFIKRHFAHKGALEHRFREKVLRDLERGGINLLEGRLSGVKAPTLLLWGENDRILHVSAVEKFQGAVADCRTEIFQKCGHVVFYDQPKASRRAHRDFLKGVGRDT